MASLTIVDTLLHSRLLEGSFLNIFDVAMKALHTDIFPQHNIANMNSDKTSYFDQSGKTFTVEGNTHTYTNTNTRI